MTMDYDMDSESVILNGFFLNFLLQTFPSDWVTINNDQFPIVATFSTVAYPGCST